MSDSLFINPLRGRSGARPPVWFMRQAGRALPAYRALREKHSFFELMRTPALAAEVTLQPVRELGVDAAILFSDILVIPEGLGMDLEFTDSGPRFDSPLKDRATPADSLRVEPARLDHVYAAIDEIRRLKPADIPLIGFCGGPLTVFCYMIQGLGTDHAFPDAVSFLYGRPEESGRLLGAIAELSAEYAREQVRHRIDAFQLFETGAGIVPAEFYARRILPHVHTILKAVREKEVPAIFFPREMGAGITSLGEGLWEGLGVDWQAPLDGMRRLVGPACVLQGNLDPRVLLLGEARAIEAFGDCLEFGRRDPNYIVNLGHGVLPGTDHRVLRALVDKVKESDWRRN
ncbi:MAG: uroporphyrinogen decarboxylase [Planctomycetes bacterium]|nr:uroporphyrinogen decarboxylase [Planctomycetota bacterium]